MLALSTRTGPTVTASTSQAEFAAKLPEGRALLVVTAG